MEFFEFISEGRWFTTMINGILGATVSAMLTSFGYPPASPDQPISDHFAMQILIALLIIAILTWVRSRLSVERPGKFQQVFELLIEGLNSQGEEIVGHGAKKFVPILFTLAIFIFLSNVAGIVPFLMTPTDQISVTLGCALVAFLYYHYWGFRHHGFLGYLRTFMGPVMAIGPLMFVIEIVSHLARALSLSVRLMANMIAGHNISVIFAGLVPLGVPVVFEGLHMVVGALQAYIFVLLSMVYLAGAVSEEH